MVKLMTTVKHKKKNNVKKYSNKNKSTKNKKTTKQKKHYKRKKYSRKMKGGKVCFNSGVNAGRCLKVVGKYGDASSGSIIKMDNENKNNLTLTPVAVTDVENVDKTVEVADGITTGSDAGPDIELVDNNEKEIVDENAPVGITGSDAGSDIELVDNSGKGIVDENAATGITVSDADSDITNESKLSLSSSEILPPIPTENLTQNPPQPLSQEEILTTSNNDGNDEKNTETIQESSQITPVKEGILDDIEVNTTTVNHTPLLRSSSDSNIGTNNINKKLLSKINQGKQLRQLTPDNAKKNDSNTFAKQLSSRRKQISQDKNDEKGKDMVKAAQDKYKLDNLNEYSKKFSEDNLNNTNIDEIMKSFNEDKTMSNQDKKDFLSQMLNNNKYSEDIIKKINESILIIDTMIDQEPKINTEKQYESDNESDYDSDSDFETEYGKSGYNKFGNLGGKTRGRRSRKMKTKKGKKRTRKMKKNKKTKKTSK